MGRSGFEPPTHGFSVRCGENTTTAKTSTSGCGTSELTPQVTPEHQERGQKHLPEPSSDLAEIVAIWPKLPVHIKVAIKAMVHTHTGGNQQ